MKNSVIHLITNRTGDFHHPSLASVDGYKIHAEPDEEASLRTFLQLKDTTTDYYIMGALGAVYAFPELFIEFDETQRTFDISLWSKDDDNFTPNGVINTDTDVFNLHRTPIEFPVEMEWIMTYTNANTMRIALGSTYYDVPVRATATTLYVDWPEELGISGAISLDAAWSSGDEFRIHHTPTRFPYSKIVELVTNRADARSIMTSRGYMRNFYLAQSDMEKCAILYTALAWPENYEWS